MGCINLLPTAKNAPPLTVVRALVVPVAVGSTLIRMLVCTLFLHDLLLHLQLYKHASTLLRISLLKIWPVLGPLLQGALFLVPILQTHLTMQLLAAILMCSKQLSSSLIAHRMPSQFFLTKGSTLLLCRTTPALPASALAIHMGNSPSFTPGRPALLKAMPYRIAPIGPH